MDEVGPQEVVGARQVEHVDDAEKMDHRIDEEVDEEELGAMVGDPVPARADRFVKSEIEHREATDRRHGRRGQERHADLLAVPREMDGEFLPLERIVDGLVAAFDFVAFEVDEHVGEARDRPHEERDRAAHDPQGRNPIANHENRDDQQRERAGQVAQERSVFQRRKPRPNRRTSAAAEPTERPAEDAELVEDEGQPPERCEGAEQQVGRLLQDPSRRAK